MLLTQQWKKWVIVTPKKIEKQNHHNFSGTVLVVFGFLFSNDLFKRTPRKPGTGKSQTFPIRQSISSLDHHTTTGWWWLEPWNFEWILYFPYFFWECHHHPNFPTDFNSSFFREVGGTRSTTIPPFLLLQSQSFSPSLQVLPSSGCGASLWPSARWREGELDSDGFIAIDYPLIIYIGDLSVI
jgi:hypothetical protein